MVLPKNDNAQLFRGLADDMRLTAIDQRHFHAIVDLEASRLLVDADNRALDDDIAAQQLHADELPLQIAARFVLFQERLETLFLPHWIALVER